MRVVPLTTLTGEELDPVFSPEGEQVAFDWNGEKQDNRDIYVTLVGSSDARRLTNDPLPDVRPAWSPDGRQIAFLRERPDGTTIQMVSALGGPDGKLSDFRGANSLSWSPDGRWLAAGRFENAAGNPAGIYLIPADGGDPRLVAAPGAARGLTEPAFAPDGHRLVYASCSRLVDFGDCDLYLTELDARMTPTKPPRRLTTQNSVGVHGITWTRDGTEVVYSAGEFATAYLWRLGIAGTRLPERLELAGANASAPAAAGARDRLAFTRFSFDWDIYRVEAGHPAQLVAGSTFVEMEPRLSPDGRRLVFGSARSGGETPDIWVSDADGSNPRQLTHLAGHFQGSPYWSPDGRRIVFDSIGGEDNKSHIWMIDADGGTPHRITTHADNEHAPTWSRDGKWIYFSSEVSSLERRRNIWRVAAAGGTAEQLTHDGSGPFACETADGSSLLFQTRVAESPLMAMPPGGGAPRQLVACVNISAFGVGSHGIYYVPCDSSSNPPVHVLDLKTGRDRVFGTLDHPTNWPMGLSVSPDGRTIVYPRQTSRNSDLMVIENFR
jgi:Tol biopolymer transport system component